ncbi:carbohydrate binding domain-containing protein [Olleya sp. HaHaR_3_96]|uniref:carbohydrate binding domain-containing protein n=1 Tax=Olleya sp. HaHaR_3_96 TaxID=2745560 RepID=UPI001C4E99B2|nr:carbohydrate binding domain-containing protein [Olleya sp. HaHaR_3_96]QXP59292.1 carbohydrate binding domain-containing protein [Olleya sp. HaHaR_3_96]
MKHFKYILSLFLIITAFVACEQDDDLLDLNAIAAPTNVAAFTTIAQGSSGIVTITPTGENVTSFVVYYGDGSETDSGVLNPGESTENAYLEGTYDIVITASGINGKTTTVAQTIVVSFQAPENLVVTIENDNAVSKQVNVTATADFAMSYDVDFGDAAGTVITTNIGEVTSFVYEAAGTYTITVTASSGSVDTISYSEAFEVTEILAPLTAAPTPPSRVAEDVVSIFSDAYTNITLNELPTDWSSTGFEATTVAGNNVWRFTNLDFVGMVSNYDNGIDISAMEMLHIDYWVPSGTDNELLVKIVNTIDGGEAVESLGATVGGSWQSIDVDMTGFDDGDLANTNKITQILIDADIVEDIVYIDNFYFYKQSATTGSFNDGLLTNGDFENGSNSWIVGVDDTAAAPVVTNSGNIYYSYDITSAGNSYDVNLSQKVEIIQGNTYTLTFNAWSDVNRAIVAGIGLSADPWSNDSQSVDITTTSTTYSITLSAADFGAIDARVIFDLGAEVGRVNIDNVSLIIGTGNTVINGNFENGSDSWIIGVEDAVAAPVVTNSGNTFYSVNVEAAGNSYDVNVSQKLEIIQGNTYTLTFDAWSDVNRSIVAGIGLSADPWSNATETVAITTNRTTYALTLVATDFGATDARILFDLGAEIGTVNIDDVTLSSN